MELPCGVQLVVPNGCGATRLGVWKRPPALYSPWRELGETVRGGTDDARVVCQGRETGLMD